MFSSFCRGEWRGEDSNLRRHSPADLQSAPFGHSGTSPHRFRRAGWSRWSESNRRPADYKSAALPMSYIGGPHHPFSARRHPRLSRGTSLAAFRAVRDPDGSGGEHVPLFVSERNATSYLDPRTLSRNQRGQTRFWTDPASSQLGEGQ